MSEQENVQAKTENTDATQMLPAPPKRETMLLAFSLKFLRALMHLLFRLAVSFFVFYVIGNYHNFLDANQLFILRLLQITAAASAVVGLLLSVLQILVFIKYKKKQRMQSVFVPVIIFIASGVLTFFATTVVVLSRM